MPENDNTHEGHRKRMTDKFNKHGITVFNEHEMLEILLFMIIPRVNTNEIAHRAIKEFGSLKNTLIAPVSELNKIKGIGNKSAHQLRYVGALMGYLNEAQAATKCQFKKSINLADYFIDHFKDKVTETLSLLLLDDKFALLHAHDITNNLPNHVTTGDFREIISLVLKYNTYKLIIAHNHLTEATNPSGDDLNFTKELYECLKSIKVKLVDHVIVANGNAKSLRDSGYLSNIWEG